MEFKDDTECRTEKRKLCNLLVATISGLLEMHM